MPYLDDCSASRVAGASQGAAEAKRVLIALGGGSRDATFMRHQMDLSQSHNSHNNHNLHGLKNSHTNDCEVREFSLDRARLPSEHLNFNSNEAQACQANTDTSARTAGV